MESAQHARLTNLLDQATQLPAADRAALLENLREQDATLAAELDSLLAAADPGERYLEALSASVLSPLQASIGQGMDTGGQPVIERLRERLDGQYRIERELGGGGMSHVFLAQDLKLDRQVVIKVLRAPGPSAAIPAPSSSQFQGEVRLAAQLQHPHIVPLLAADAVDGLLYYTMPFVAGESLRQSLRQRGRLAVSEALRIWRDILDAIAHAHARGVVHRDIKPGNILLSGRHALVTDFGIAVALQGVSSEAAMQAAPLVGTPAYMAPEQHAGSVVVDKSVDLYQAGLVMFEMLAGHLPAAGPMPERADLPRPLAALIARCLASDPADRPPSADAVLAQIDHIGTKPQRFPRSWLAAAGLGSVALLAALAFWQPQREAPRAVPRTSSAIAWDWYQKGAAPALHRSNDGMTEAIGHFRKAIEADPDFAGAHARLASTLQFVATRLPPEDAQRKVMLAESRKEMDLALSLDEADPDAHVTMGRWYLFDGRDLKRSEAELQRAVAIDPTIWRGHESLSMLYMYAGRPAEQLQAAQQARQFEPNSIGATRVWALALAEHGRCEESLATLQEFQNLTPPATVAGVLRGLCLMVLGRWGEAIRDLQWADDHGARAAPGFIAFALARDGQRAAAEALLQDLLAGRVYSHGAFGVAMAYIGLGDRVQGLDWLERSAAENTLRPYVLHPVLAELRGDPRYERIKARLDTASE